MITVDNLKVSYEDKNVLELGSFTFPEGKITGVIGRNGSGKSTFLKAIAGVLPYKGSLKVGKDEITSVPSELRARRISYLPQRVVSADMTVKMLVRHGRYPWKSFPRRLNSDDKRIVDDAIARVGINGLSSKNLKSISGGELKLSYLAMILAQQTDIILLDEPEAHLDTEHRQLLYNTLSSLRDEGKTVVFTSHNLTESMPVFDKVLILDRGKDVFFGDPEEAKTKL
ncbi:MAG: ABC transporter ATP-binding protein [Clostridiales bacterium]|nr:ABC transporter ATP-binding protein [Clostridiales bacterium]